MGTTKSKLGLITKSVGKQSRWITWFEFLTAFTAVLSLTCHTVKGHWSGWLSSKTPTPCSAGALWYSKFHLKASVFDARICITQSYRLKVPDGEPRSCLDWLFASNNVPRFGSVLLDGSRCEIRLATGVHSLINLRTETLHSIRQSLCFVLCLHGPIHKSAAMFNRIRSARLKVCDRSQRFYIGWLIVGDGVSCCGKGHAGSITTQGHCGHA